MAASSIFADGFKTDPYWWDAAPPDDEGDAPPPERADVAIVGSGYTGLSAALELARGGVDVAVLEAHRFGEGLEIIIICCIVIVWLEQRNDTRTGRIHETVSATRPVKRLVETCKIVLEWCHAFDRNLTDDPNVTFLFGEANCSGYTFNTSHVNGNITFHMTD